MIDELHVLTAAHCVEQNAIVHIHPYFVDDDETMPGVQVGQFLRALCENESPLRNVSLHSKQFMWYHVLASACSTNGGQSEFFLIKLKTINPLQQLNFLYCIALHSRLCLSISMCGAEIASHSNQEINRSEMCTL